MAAANIDVWIPEERGSDVLEVISRASAVEALARRESMGSDTKSVSSVLNVDVDVIAKGAKYDESGTVGADVLLTARKFGQIVRLNDEDVKDSAVDAIRAAQIGFANTYAVKLDNAALGVTAAENGTTVPFTSVYRLVAQSTTASGNLVKSAGAVTYEDLSGVLAASELGNTGGELVIIAHPSFKGVFRGLKSTDGVPLFVQGLAGTPDTLFGYTVAWSLGARTSTTATDQPTGNPLLIAAPKNCLILGVRTPSLETAIAPADSGAAFEYDQALVKMRSRRGFAAVDAASIGIIEVTAS